MMDSSKISGKHPGLNEDKITRNVWVLGFTSMLNDASKTLLTLILPLYLEFIGATAFIIGIIVGLSASVGSVANAFTGYLSDRTKKTKFYATFGYALLPVSRFLLLFAGTWPFVLVLRLVNDVGEGMKDSPRDVILTTSVSKKVRGKAYGIHRTLHTIGAVIGTLIAIYILFGISSPDKITMDTYNLIFIISSVLAVLGFAVIYFFLEEREKPPEMVEKIKFGFIKSGAKSFVGAVKKIKIYIINREFKLLVIKAAKKIRLYFFNSDFKIFIIIAGIFSLGNFAVWFMVLKTAGALNMSSSIFGSPDVALAYLMFPVVFAIFATPVGALSDKVSRRIVVSAGYALFGFICIGFIFVSSLAGFMVLFALYGLFWAATHAMQRAFTVDLAGEDKRGTALGIYHSVAGVLALPANAFAGYLWDMSAVPGTATFLFGAVIAFISAVLLFVLIKK